MSNSIMNIMGLVQFASVKEFGIQQAVPTDGPSFSQFVEQKCAELSREGKNMLGVKPQGGGVHDSDTIFLDHEFLNSSTGSEILHQLVFKLKELALDTKDVGAGEWQVPKMALGNLENIAEAAGMNPAQFGVLNLKMEEQSAPLVLTDLFTLLEKHFHALNEEIAVTAPETSLPLLMSFLEKMGLPAEQVEKIAEASVNDLGEFDLAIFLKGLQEVRPEDIRPRIPTDLGEIRPQIPRAYGKARPQILTEFGETRSQNPTEFGEIRSQNPTESGEIRPQIPTEFGETRPQVQWKFEKNQQPISPFAGETRFQSSFGAENNQLSPSFRHEEGQVQITLTNWETEQLQDMLADAGLSEDMLKKFFPKDPSFLHEALKSLTGKDIPLPEPKTGPTQLNLSQLKEMLQHTIADAELAAPKVNVPVFVSQLEGLLRRAGFKEEGVGFTPVVQGSVAAIFQELQKMIDQSKVRIEKVPETPNVQDEFRHQMPTFGDVEEGEAIFSTHVSEETELLPGLFGAHEGGEKHTLMGEAQTNTSLGLPQQANIEGQAPQETAEPKAGQPRFRMSPEMQQFTLDQISQTVARGLKNSQHHLTLTLYPKELGEVKVDMQVRDNQVSLAFLMETPKVKELLEGNMQEFKNSMEQRGFIIQGCDVSVDHRGKEDGAQKQFELVRSWRDENTRRVSSEEVAELLETGQTGRLSAHDGFINMMV